MDDDDDDDDDDVDSDDYYDDDDDDDDHKIEYEGGHWAEWTSSAAIGYFIAETLYTSVAHRFEHHCYSYDDADDDDE